ncbi:MAG TPA: hypothetical protein VFL57_06990 [Bryobacteraceae bacterium]|nr:hypothetical protein [Bryobacteraceae bacterium]
MWRSTQRRNIYVCGFARASFPTLATSFVPQAPFGGFVSKLDLTTGQLVYSTYVPGVMTPLTGPFSKLAITVDSRGHAYVTGPASAGFPATAGAFQTETASDPFARYPGADAFLLELDASGSRAVFATLFGSDGNDHGMAVAVTGESITIAGVSSSWFLPVRDYGLPVCNVTSFYYDFGVPYRTFVASFDHAGKLVTSFTYGECREEYPTDLAQAPSGRLLLTGTANTLRSSFLFDIDLKASVPVQVEAVANSASFQVGPHAPLEMVTLFGSGLSPSRALTAVPTGGMFPTVLGGTRVMIGGLAAPHSPSAPIAYKLSFHRRCRFPGRRSRS